MRVVSFVFHAFVFCVVFRRFHGGGVAIIIVGIVVTLNVAVVYRDASAAAVVVVIGSNESLSFYSQQTFQNKCDRMTLLMM